MRKFFFLFLSFLMISFIVVAADKTWTGASGGNWSTAGNWSGGVPGAADRAIFNTSVTINIDPATIILASILITNNSNVVFSTAISTTITVTSSSVAQPGLQINAGSTLINRTIADVDFDFIFDTSTAAIGTINGNWTFDGTTVLNFGIGSQFTTALGSVVTVNTGGRISMNTNSGNIPATIPAALIFNAGSFYTYNKNEGTVPNANYNTTSTIEILGVVDVFPSFEGFPPNLGNLTINVPGMNDTYSLSMVDGTTIKGNLAILSTNGYALVLMNNNGTYTSPVTLNVNGNVTISGSTSVVFAETDPSNKNKDYQFIIGGNFTQTGGAFSLQNYDGMKAVTTMKLAGNFNQSGGTFTANSIATDATKNLFVVEMNGAGAQTFNSVTGTIDNAQNQVALQINNTSGGVSLLSPLSVGRLGFTSGILTTTVTNILTVNDANNTQFADNNPGAGKYVNGPMIRNTALGGDYIFPTGKGGVYGPVTIKTPFAISPSSFKAEYFNNGYADLTVDVSLLGVSNAQYWDVNKISGTRDVQIQLDLNALVPGVTAVDTLLVARYNGADWVNERGTTGSHIYPGNVATGSVYSQIQTSYGLYTFGFYLNSALPINLLTFSAEKAGQLANIKWSVDGNSTAKYFDVLKSGDGRSFNLLTTINAVQSQLDYKTIDNTLLNGTNYYRLKMVDKSGEVTFSKIVAVINNTKGFAVTNLAPTVVSTNAMLTVSTARGGEMEVFVTDMLGRIWRKFGVMLAAGSTQQQLNLSDLGAGAYIITAVMDGEQSIPIRFIKQ